MLFHSSTRFWSIPSAVLLGMVSLSAYLQADPRVDFWGFGKNNIAVETEDGLVSLAHDYTLFQEGDFSIRIDFKAATSTQNVRLLPGPHMPGWELEPGFNLRGWLRWSGNDGITLEMRLRDDNGNSLSKNLQLTADEWLLIEWTVPQPGAQQSFDFSSVEAIELKGDFADGTLHLDDFYFQSADKSRQLGVSSYPLTQLMEQAERTRKLRAAEAFASASDQGLREAFKPMLADFYLGRNLEQANELLISVLTSRDKDLRFRFRLNDHWCLVNNQLLYRLYYHFGSNGNIAPGRLTMEAENALLDELWERTYEKNDISLTEMSTWWMIGSENHDLITKVSSLISSRIFMNEPRFKDRRYPSYGDGGASGYWFHYVADETGSPGPKGLSRRESTETFTPAEHYAAWVAFFREYFEQRGKKGFFLEVASPGYMSVTLSHVMDLYDLGGDEGLSQQAAALLDLAWIDWAHEALSGVRGGAKTRTVNGLFWNNDSMYKMSEFEFGGKMPGIAGNYFVPLLTEYRIPAIAWEMALNRNALGRFAFSSRRPGEEEGNLPRPDGAERTLLVDTESRLYRYSWITPDYILGSQMDHPLAIHSHLSVAARWQGVTFASDDGARVFPAAINQREGANFALSRNHVMRNAQHKNVMISQQARRWSQVNPQWFPEVDVSSLPLGVFFGNNMDEIREQAGWIFVRKNRAFLAVRPVAGPDARGFRVGHDIIDAEITAPLLEDTYDWNSARTMIRFRDPFSPVIFDAGNAADYANFDAFIETILQNPIELRKTVVPGWYLLEYTGSGDAGKIYFNAANSEIPRINGRAINYTPDFLFKSPFMRSQYNTGVIETSAPSGSNRSFDLRQN